MTLTQTIAAKLKGRNVTCNVILPSVIDTPAAAGARRYQVHRHGRLSQHTLGHAPISSLDKPLRPCVALTTPWQSHERQPPAAFE